MLTPLQRLIQKLQSLEDAHSYDDLEIKIAYGNAISLAEGLLEEEKEFIEKVYEDGMDDINNALHYLPSNGKEYYDHKFKK